MKSHKTVLRKLYEPDLHQVWDVVRCCFGEEKKVRNLCLAGWAGHPGQGQDIRLIPRFREGNERGDSDTAEDGLTQAVFGTPQEGAVCVID